MIFSPRVPKGEPRTPRHDRGTHPRARRGGVARRGRVGFSATRTAKVRSPRAADLSDSSLTSLMESSGTATGVDAIHPNDQGHQMIADTSRTNSSRFDAGGLTQRTTVRVLRPRAIPPHHCNVRSMAGVGSWWDGRHIVSLTVRCRFALQPVDALSLPVMSRPRRSGRSSAAPMGRGTLSSAGCQSSGASRRMSRGRSRSRAAAGRHR